MDKFTQTLKSNTEKITFSPINEILIPSKVTITRNGLMETLEYKIEKLRNIAQNSAINMRFGAIATLKAKWQLAKIIEQHQKNAGNKTATESKKIVGQWTNLSENEIRRIYQLRVLKALEIKFLNQSEALLLIKEKNAKNDTNKAPKTPKTPKVKKTVLETIKGLTGQLSDGEKLELIKFLQS